MVRSAGNGTFGLGGGAIERRHDRSGGGPNAGAAAATRGQCPLGQRDGERRCRRDVTSVTRLPRPRPSLSRRRRRQSNFAVREHARVRSTSPGNEATITVISYADRLVLDGLPVTGVTMKQRGLRRSTLTVTCQGGGPRPSPDARNLTGLIRSSAPATPSVRGPATESSRERAPARTFKALSEGGPGASRTSSSNFSFQPPLPPT